MKKLFALVVLGLFLFGCTGSSQPGPASPPAQVEVTQAADGQGTVQPNPADSNPVDIEAQPSSDNDSQAPAENGSMMAVQEFSITAKTWEFQPATITVRKNIPVKLTVTSIDVAHGFSISEFNVNVRLEPGQETVVEFTPDATGTFNFFCSVFCGNGHGGMRGTLVVTD